MNKMPAKSSASKHQRTKGEPRGTDDASTSSVPAVKPPHDARSTIMAAAVELFYRHGYQATTVQDIVDLAGYTKGALYYYFNSKEDLLLEIHDVFMSYGLDRGREIIASDEPAPMKIALVVRELLRQVQLYRPQMTIVLQETRLINFSKYPEAKAKRDEWEQIVVAIIESGMESGEFRGDLGSAKVISFGITGMCVWPYHWLSHAGEMTADEISEMYASIVLGGLMNTSAPTKRHDDHAHLILPRVAH